MIPHHRMFIEGQWCDAVGGATYAVIAPATGQVFEEIPYGDAEDTRRAIDAAHEAYDDWRHRTAYERAEVLKGTAQLMRERVGLIGALLTHEVGKTLGESKGETLAAAAQFEWYAEEAKRVYGRWVPSSKDANRRWVLRMPIGVTGAVSPWNFPVLLPARKIAPAMAVGCTVVTRPASQAPLASMEMVRCIEEAGCPAGVINLITGPARETVGALMRDPRVRKVSFTGSTEVGKELIRESAGQIKKLSLELGGSAPVLIFPDMDPAEAARLSVMGKFRNNGQVCISPARFYVHESIAGEYIRACVEAAKALRLGNGMEPDVDVGPMFDEAGVERAERLVADATAKGAKVLCGGKRPKGNRYADGFYFEPTVLVDIAPDMCLVCEETFCPVMPIIPFSSTEDAIALGNATDYGLAAYVLTRDIDTGIRCAEELEFGIIGLNDMVPATAEAPFGGMKESGLGGREGGSEGIDAYLETKYVSLGLGGP